MSGPPFGSLIARFQHFAGELTDVEGPEDLSAALSHLAHDTPAPRNQLEYVVISYLIMRTIVAVSTYLHAPWSAFTCSCDRTTVDAMVMLLKPTPGDAQQVFQQWSDRFVQAYETNHLSSPAAAAAKLIRRTPAHAWNVSELARLQHVTPRHLLRQFALEHGISIRDYVHLVRLKRAFPLLVEGTDKIEAIALEFGYRSKKDFYRTVWTWLKATPAQLRRLSQVEQSRARALLQQAYASTLQRRFRGASRAALLDRPPRRTPRTVTS